MAMNLEPRLDALESALERGALMRIDRGAGHFAGSTVTASGATVTASTSGQQVMQFQFNPETVTRTRTGQWDPRLKRQNAKIPPTAEVRGTATMGSSALLAESEQLSFKIVFDATEAVLAGRAGAAAAGVLPQLAFLELVSQGREGNIADDPKKQDKAKELIQPIRPDELLLVLGSARIFPVVLTSLSITEQKFLPTLVPLRAEVELKLTVLEPIESRYSVLVDVAFDELTRRRSRASEEHATTSSLVGAIWAALGGS
jgi:hypothetical protein